jgi:inositol phosphorylceramide mannosyltransferase catalytic subunit
MIPKIHHLLWCTPNDFSPKFHEYRLSWMRFNPSWNFILWRLENLPYEKFPPVCSEMLKHPDLHWILKSDIARWLLLWIFGGVYSDTDVECLKPMDIFLKDFGFCGKSITPGIAGNAVVGGIRGYTLFLQIACAHAGKIKSNLADANKNIVDYGVNLAGKMLLDCDNIYQREYFYPVSSGFRKEKKIFNARDFPDSYCVHHWSGMDEDGWYRETIGKRK